MLNVETTMVVILLKILIIIGIGFISATISWFLQYLFKWNLIGQKYIIILRLIKTKIKNKKRNKIFEHLMKPLGYCVYCQSPYIAMILSLYYLEFNIIELIMVVGTNYFFIEKMKSITY